MIYSVKNQNIEKSQGQTLIILSECLKICSEQNVSRPMNAFNALKDAPLLFFQVTTVLNSTNVTIITHNTFSLFTNI